MSERGAVYVLGERLDATLSRRDRLERSRARGLTTLNQKMQKDSVIEK